MNKRKKAVSHSPKRKASRAKPVAKSTAKRVTNSVAEPVASMVAEPADQPAANPVAQLIAEPVANAAQPAPTSLTLGAECLVADASSLKANLAGLLDQPAPVTLDIAALQRIDTAALQLITAFVRERAEHERAVEWQGTAPVLVTAARLLGLTTLLNLPA